MAGRARLLCKGRNQNSGEDLCLPRPGQRLISRFSVRPVSYTHLSFRAARWLRLDERAAARGGLLHDLYLYDPRDKSAHPGSQCFDHPRAAARNAEQVTKLSDKERNIIPVSYTHLDVYKRQV